MTKTFTASAMILLLATSSAALAQDHRPGDAALGALSGAVVLGPIGAVAGAVVGYTAGPSIARSLGFDRRGVAWIEQNLAPLLIGPATAVAGPVIVHTLA